MGARRIAHVVSNPSGIGGAERVVASLAGRQSDQTWKHVVLNPFASGADDELSTLFEDGVYSSHRCARTWEVPSARRWLRRALLDFRPDVTHAHLFHAEVLVASLPRKVTGMRLLTHHHGSHYREHRHRVLTLMDRVAGARFDSVVAVSPVVESFLLATYGYEARKVVTIENGWEGHPLPPERPPDPTALCTANFRAEKGHRVLAAAWGTVTRALPNAVLVLVGSGPTLQEVQAYVAEAGIDGVRFEGLTQDVWPYLARAHVFVLPSLSETFGIAALEAMAAGLPVIASEVGGLPALVESGVTGVLVPPRDSAALADALILLLTDADKREKMAQAARRRAQDFTLERTLRAYREHYESLMGRGSTRPA